MIRAGCDAVSGFSPAPSLACSVTYLPPAGVFYFPSVALKLVSFSPKRLDYTA